MSPRTGRSARTSLFLLPRMAKVAGNHTSNGTSFDLDAPRPGRMQRHLATKDIASTADVHSSLEPQWMMRARSSARSKAASEGLELEYASSLIRVIRSRGNARGPTAECVLHSPEKQPLTAMEGMLLLSGCGKFKPAERRVPNEKLAPLAHGALPASVPGSSCCSPNTGESGGRVLHVSEHLQRSCASKGGRRLSPSRSPVPQMLQEHRLPEVSVLARLPSKSPHTREQHRSGQDRIDLEEGEASNSPLARHVARAKQGLSSQSAAGQRRQCADHSTESTLKICRNCNEMFEDAFAQSRLEQCHAVIACACQLVEPSRLESAQPDSEIAELAARTWTNAGLLYSYEQKAQEATDSFSKALIFRMGTRDVVALASAHANFALSLIDVNDFHLALQHASTALKISLDALKVGPIHTLRDVDIPCGGDAHQLLKTAATSLLAQGVVNERLGRECLTAYQNATFVARHIAQGSQGLVQKIQNSYTSALQRELQQASSIQGPSKLHPKVFHTHRNLGDMSTMLLQQELVLRCAGEPSPRFLVGTDVEFEAAHKVNGIADGMPMPSRHLRTLALSCAVTLQSGYRCRLARRALSHQLQLLPPKSATAVSIQKILRGFLGRRFARSLEQRRRHSSLVLLQACIQRRLQHAVLLRRLIMATSPRIGLIRVERASPSSTSAALRARLLLDETFPSAYSGHTSLDPSDRQSTAPHKPAVHWRLVTDCMRLLRDRGFSANSVETFELLLNRGESFVRVQTPDGLLARLHATTSADKFYTAVLDVLLLSVDPGEREDVREACTVFDVLQRHQAPEHLCAAVTASTVTGRRTILGSNCAALLSTLGYSDQEVDGIVISLQEHADFVEAHAAASKENSRDDWAVTRATFVEAMTAMLGRARALRQWEESRRRVAKEIEIFEPSHPLMRIARIKTSVRLQNAWRCKLARSHMCQAMGRPFSGCQAEVSVFIKLYRQSVLRDEIHNLKARELQCALRVFFAKKTLMRERLQRPRLLLEHICMLREKAVVTLQKWLFRCQSAEIMRSKRKLSWCTRLQCAMRSHKARRNFQERRRHVASCQIQSFFCVNVIMTSLKIRHKRHAAVTVLQTGCRRFMAKKDFMAKQEESERRKALRSQAASFARPVIRRAYQAYRARRLLSQLQLQQHVRDHLGPIITRAAKCHFARKSLLIRKRLLMSTVVLEASFRRVLRHHAYCLWVSGHPGSEKLQCAWKRKRARARFAAAKLVPFFLRAIAMSRVTPMFLVSVVEARAGLAAGSLCLHCLTSAAGGDSGSTCINALHRSAALQANGVGQRTTASVTAQDAENIPGPVPVTGPSPENVPSAAGSAGVGKSTVSARLGGYHMRLGF